MIYRFLLCTTFIIMVSCSSNPTIKNSFNNSVNCSGFKGWDYCYSQAKVTCNNGFYIVDSSEDIVTQTRKMTFQCKK